MQREPEITTRSLTKKFQDITALDSLDLSIERGEVFGLLGPNGAGKTTTINILCGIDRPTSGKAFVGGIDVAARPDLVKSLIGVCAQGASVFGHLTGKENIEMFGELNSLTRKEAKARADKLLFMMGLNEDKDRRAGKYSEGMKRRLSLAMALVAEPRIVFLDEPTAAMDPQSRRAVWDVVADMKNDGRTVILTTHYIEEAESLCDRVGIIDHGKLIALDQPIGMVSRYGKKDLEEVFIHLTGRRIREG